MPGASKARRPARTSAPPAPGGAVSRPVRRVPRRGRARDAADRVVGEEPLEIRVGDRPLAVMMRTPGDDLDLVAGFLLTEGIVSSPRDLLRLEPAPARDGESHPRNAVVVTLAPGVSVPEERWKRAIAASAACGLCGKVAIEDVIVRAPPVRSAVRVRRATLLALPGRLRAAQPLFSETGGLHAAGLFDAGGRLLVAREDVGRHNAVDKVVGHLARTRAPGAPAAEDTILLASGRAGFEIVQKALVARIPVVAAVGAPTSLSVDLARRGGMTLVAFLRPGGFSVYAGEERVL